MDKWDNYMIRACKRCDGTEDIELLDYIFRKRCGLDKDYPKNRLLWNIACHLWDIIEEYNLTTLAKVVQMFGVEDDWDDKSKYQSLYPDINQKTTFILGRAISVIAHSRTDKFPEDFYWGLRWRYNSNVKKSPYSKDKSGL